MNAKLVLASRILLGLVFFIFGINGLMMFTLGKGFIPAPPPSPEMGVIMGGFMATKYLMPLVKILEIIAGALLLSGMFMNLAIVLLAPIIVNILGIHFFVELSGAPIAIIILVLFAILIKSRWEYFKPLLNK
jgi:putative oxidoreductase